MNKTELLEIIIKIVSDNNLSVINSFNKIELILRSKYKIDCGATNYSSFVQFHYENKDGREIYLNLDDSIVASMRKRKLRKI